MVNSGIICAISKSTLIHRGFIGTIHKTSFCILVDGPIVKVIEALTLTIALGFLDFISLALGWLVELVVESLLIVPSPMRIFISIRA